MSRIVAVALVCLLASLATSAQAVHYTLRDLGVLPGFVEYYGEGVNDRGEVVGRAFTSTHSARAFAWDSINGMRFIGDPGSTAFGINNYGVAVIQEAGKLALWDNVNGTRYMASNIYGFAINDRGQVAGTSGGNAVVWDEVNGMCTFDHLPGDNGSFASAINNDGAVAGRSDGQYPLVHAAIWDGTNGIRSLGTLPGYYSSYAWGINDLGQVVGDCRDYTQSNYRAFVWDSVRGIRDLGISGFARDINNAGQIVGESFGSVGAYVYDDVHGVTSLPRLVAGKPAMAHEISENGFIVGTSIASDGKWHAVMWTPVPEPSSIFTLLCGIGGIGGVIWRRKSA